MNSNWVIAGTDTGVGKTYFTCLLATLLKNRGKSVQVYKPFETGVSLKNGKAFPEDALALKKSSGTSQAIESICYYPLKLPASPYQAAKAENVLIDFNQTLNRIRKSADSKYFNLLELAGGLLVPITEQKTNLDLIRKLKWPVILVAANRLGCVNHSLLSLEILRKILPAHKIFLMLNQIQKKSNSKLGNLDQIKMFSKGIKCVEFGYKSKGEEILPWIDEQL